MRDTPAKRLPCLHGQAFGGQRTANSEAVSWHRRAPAVLARAGIWRATDSEQRSCELASETTVRFFMKEGVNMTLKEFFEQTPRAAAAFSGGTDSAFVLWAAKKYGCDVRAYYVNTAFQPAFELEDARRLTQELEIPMTVVDMDILSVPEAVDNRKERCYYCKRAIFTRLREAAHADGYPVLLDGTNASDDAGDRPGMRALRELEVRSPLRECGVTKEQVRERSKEAGIFTWDKPAYACLATRIPSGTPIKREDLERVEQAENAMTALGFRDFRVRLYGDGARIQVTEAQMQLVTERRKEICEKLRRLFSAVLLDLEERRPSD